MFTQTKLPTQLNLLRAQFNLLRKPLNLLRTVRYFEHHIEITSLRYTVFSQAKSKLASVSKINSNKYLVTLRRRSIIGSFRSPRSPTSPTFSNFQFLRSPRSLTSPSFPELQLRSDSSQSGSDTPTPSPKIPRFFRDDQPLPSFDRDIDLGIDTGEIYDSVDIFDAALLQLDGKTSHLFGLPTALRLKIYGFCFPENNL